MGKSGLPSFRLGCCAMPSKLASVPMRTILQTLVEVGNFQLVEFTEEHLITAPVTEWPKVDCLIAFYSRDYPLSKVCDYVRLTKPIVFNDVGMQYVLRNRREVYAHLNAANIPTPRHIVVDHEAVRAGRATLIEDEDYFIYNGVRMDKPFLEKPEDADDHNNYVYYPKNTGGGCKKLFRKLANRSSEYYSDINRIRRDGVYLYEEFLPTLGTDIKVYTVGPMFAHAEARKSPTLDGRVQRTENGKEERYPVLLNDEEKLISYMVVETFKQTVCGFDILRTINGRAVVCDVNGWSFVKGNSKYYIDCASILSAMFVNAMRRRRFYLLAKSPNYSQFLWRSGSTRLGSDYKCACILDEIDREDMSVGMPNNDINDDVENSGTFMDDDDTEPTQELQTIVVVMRHGDRSPKQKLKFSTRCRTLIKYFKSKQINEGPAKVVKIRNLQDLNDFQMLNEEVLTTEELSNEARENHLKIKALLSTKEMLDITRKVQLFVPKSATNTGDLSALEEITIVVKWGGELTPIGLESSEALGHRMREKLYPGEKDGLLRLHSTFRHDFKIYTSDEGRCQLTAAAFTKGFLDLDGDLPPILVQMVTRDGKAQELFDEGEYTKTVRTCKEFIQTIIHTSLSADELCAKYFQPKFEVSCPTCLEQDNIQITGEEDIESVTSEIYERDRVWSRLLGDYHKALMQICPIEATCVKVHKSILAAIEALSEFVELSSVQVTSGTAKVSDTQNSTAQSLKRITQMLIRWNTLSSTWFKRSSADSKVSIDATKIPEVYDNARYDLLHNAFHLRRANAFVHLSNVQEGTCVLGPLVSALEFGVTPEEKVEIGAKTVPKLIRKIADDLIAQQRKSLEFERSDITKSLPMWAKSKGSIPSGRPSTASSSGGTGGDKYQDSSDPTSVRDEEHIILRQKEARRMGIKSPWRKVRSRYYAASASHVVSLINVLSYTEFSSRASRYRRHLTTGSSVCANPEASGTTVSAVSKFESPERPLTARATTPSSFEESIHAFGATSLSTSRPLVISAADTPYLSHFHIRVWRPTRKQTGVSLNDLTVELCWNPNGIDEPLSSIYCNVAELHTLLRSCMNDEHSSSGHIGFQGLAHPSVDIQPRAVDSDAV